MFFYRLLVLLVAFARNAVGYPKQPNIIVIMADDLGWNDVGFHGSDQIPTPNIDALAYNGIVLQKFYAQSSGTASRAAMMTGVYPMRYGFQGGPLDAANPGYLPLNLPTLPEALGKLGYQNYMVGRWGLGSAYQKVTPLGRGFDKFFGTYSRNVDKFTYKTSAVDPGTGVEIHGFDLHDGFETYWAGYGQYATDLFTAKACEYIKAHDYTKPMFLFLAHLVPHVKPGGDMDVPDTFFATTKYKYIYDYNRRIYADTISRLDDSIGKVVEALAATQMLENSIVLFLSDNGANPVDPLTNYGSNWPLRGLKSTPFEGGVRVAAALYSPLLKDKNSISYELMHVTDLLPTFYSAAGGDVKDLGIIDGVDQWDTIRHDKNGKRYDLLVELDERYQISALISDYGHYKLYNGTIYPGRVFDGYFGDSGRLPQTPRYEIGVILNSPTNLVIQNQHGQPKLYADKIWDIRDKLVVYCPHLDVPKTCDRFCLYDLNEDPCETTDLFEVRLPLAKKLTEELGEYWDEYYPQLEYLVDLRANPIYFNGTWNTWLDKNVIY